MKTSLNSRVGFACIFIFCALLLSCGKFYQGRKNMVLHSTEHTKTLCIGRFLIDVPENAIVNYRGASLSGWDISSWIETDEKFFDRNTAEEVKLRSEKNERGGTSLEKVIEVKNSDSRGRIFVFNRLWLEMFDAGKKKESQVVAIRALVRVQNITYSFYAKIRFDNDVEELEKIIEQLRHRSVDGMPTQPGFCFQNAFFMEPLSADQSEFTAMFVGLKEHPDLAIALSTLAGIAPEKPLLQREAENNIKNEYRSRFHTMRQGPRKLNGILGDEVVDRVTEPNGSVLHEFMWESLNTKDDVYRPLLSLELSTGRGQLGRPVNSSLSDTEVLALWDKISASLRVRPISESSSTLPANSR